MPLKVKKLESGKEIIETFAVVSNVFVREMDRPNTVCIYAATPVDQLDEATIEVCFFKNFFDFLMYEILSFSETIV